ncbi:MAG TPA: carbohydrate kinase [Chthoniobacteraceae bacterium]|nr:carbohydrate kinase [Chthoniobacteraceae bacterium]
MNSRSHCRVLCFGEVLWDCLPSGRLPGGAPLNVAYHLARLGADAVMISAVGADALGDEMLGYLVSRGLNTEFIARHRRLPTGVVTVALSAGGQPSYTIEEGVAWDDIGGDGEWRAALSGADALVFGSLAARTAANRATLEELLAAQLPLRLMDVNLRAPFDERDRVVAFASRADWIKLNDDELERLTARKPAHGKWPDNLLPAIEAFAELAGCPRVCVTCGARGAVLWNDGAFVSATAPAVKVRDTVGAGDAFTAALVHSLLKTPGDARGILERACALGALVASLPGGQPDYDPQGISGMSGDRLRIE